MTHERHGELLPNGFYVGDLVSYTNSIGDEVRYGVIVPTPERWVRRNRAGNPEGPRSTNAKWSARWSPNPDDARDGYRAYNPDLENESYTTREATLIARFDGTPPSATTEGSAAMTAEAQGTWEPTTEGIPAGTRFRFYHDTDPIVEENFAYEGTMLDWSARRFRLDVAGTYGEYEVGNDMTIDCHEYQLPSYRAWTPAPVAAADQEEAYDGTKGAFLPHNGEMPEPGTIVRGTVPGLTRQVEGLFLKLADDGSNTAMVERKRKRTKRANGTFSAWEAYANVGRVQIAIDGAEVFKAGASKPGSPVWVRERGITTSGTEGRAEVGQVISGPSYDTMHNTRPVIFRGVVVDTHHYGGEYTIRAAEQATVNRRDPVGEYDFKPIAERNVMVYATFSEARDERARGSYVWEKLAPGQRPLDPAFDPKRKTSYTGMGIGDLVVGLVYGGGRDTVSSWVKGEIFKWDIWHNRPIVKVTDKMESTRKVGDEAALSADDVYPAMADPATVSPEEYKKTLRLYLIGRHKRGDFCRGGLNTMLAAHGIPLYETRRRAQMVVTVDYDPNETDLYTVQTDLRSKMAGVVGLTFTERTGEDIELAVESDTTQG